MQLVFRLLFLLVDIVGNIYTLSTNQPFLVGTALPLNDSQFIVLFNAAMIMIIYIVDFVIVKLQRRNIVVHVGERMLQ